MSSFRFGLWVGFVAGIVMAVLWNSEPEWDAEAIAIMEEPSQDWDNSDIATSAASVEELH